MVNLPPPIYPEHILDEAAYGQITYDPDIEWPGISIVTPSYQQGPYIETTIRSILLQGYPKLQYFVMDGGSKDQTVEILKYYDAFIDGWVSEKDRGQSEAINKGLKQCTQPIFNWINSDDWLLPGALYTIGKTFATTGADMVASRANIWQEGEILWVNGYTPKKEDVIESALMTGLNQQGLFLRTDKFQQIGGVDEVYHYSMDMDMWVRYLLTYGQDKFEVIDDVTAVFRFHPECKSVMEGWAEGSASDKETKSMRRRLVATLNDPRYAPVVDYVFPNPRLDICDLPPHSPIDPKVVGTWINRILFRKMKRAFYGNENEVARQIAPGIDPAYLPEKDAKDFQAFSRYLQRTKGSLGPVWRLVYGFKKLTGS
jgi:glycosyltransferase involved in cell wall biosynthesis